MIDNCPLCGMPDTAGFPCECPETCTFGHSGSRVEACDFDAEPGEDYCTHHLEVLYG